MPFIATNRRAAADPFGEFPTELLGPAANGFMADDDPARGQHFLDHPQAQREPKIEPNRIADHLGREAMAAIKRITMDLLSAKLSPIDSGEITFVGRSPVTISRV
jgi:hypothetical protein